jgi:hypothetical protein
MMKIRGWSKLFPLKDNVQFSLDTMNKLQLIFYLGSKHFKLTPQPNFSTDSSHDMCFTM